MNWTRIAGIGAFGLSLGLLAGLLDGRSARAQAPAASSAPASSMVSDRPAHIEFDQADGRITVHTGEVDVRRLLEVVSRRAGVSLAISPRVHGTIIADFEKVTAEELLRAVLKMTNLVEKVDGGIHLVYTREELDEAAHLEPTVEQPRTSPPAAPRPTVLGRLFRSWSTGRERRGGAAARPELVVRRDERNQAAADLSPPSAAPVLLNVGSRIEAMSAGRLPPGAPIWTPAPAPRPKVDPAVATAGLQVEHAAPPPAPPLRRREVRAGETFESLAQAHYGSPRFARALWWANRAEVAWPGALAAGKWIVIPPSSDLNPKLVAARSTAPAPTALPTLERITVDATPAPRSDHQVQPASLVRSAAPRPPVEGGVAVYVVRPGDTIRGVAVACLGDGSRAAEIAELNRELLRVEGRPRVGQRLILPPGANPP